MAGEFFDNVGKVIAGPSLPRGDGVAGYRRGAGQVFTAPSGERPRASQAGLPRRASPSGAGLVVLGVVVGSLFGRRAGERPRRC